eukprot:3073758-Prymnesium_polylepis.1
MAIVWKGARCGLVGSRGALVHRLLAALCLGVPFACNHAASESETPDPSDTPHGVEFCSCQAGASALLAAVAPAATASRPSMTSAAAQRACMLLRVRWSLD